MIMDFPVWQLFIISISGLLKMFFQPMFYLALFMVYWQCKSVHDQQRAMFGHENMPLLPSVLTSAATGIVGGMIASMLVLSTGLSVNRMGVEYLWPLALALLLVNLRFLCFAYAGGIIALSNIIFGWPDIAPANVLGLVAILHITESILVFIGGKYSDMPIYVRHDEQAVGGFMLSNLWPLPLILMVAFGAPQNDMMQMLHMPEWWPLFPVPEVMPGHTNIMMPITLAAVLGYSSVAITVDPTAKRRFSAIVLFIYSLILLVLSYLSVGSKVLGVIAALTSFLGHELAVRLDQSLEKRGEPLYRRRPEKMVVLSALYDSPAQKAGVRSGDIIRYIDGAKIYDEIDVETLMHFLPDRFDITVQRGGKDIKIPVDIAENKHRLFGMIPMPIHGRDRLMMLDPNYSILLRWYKKYKRYRAYKNIAKNKKR